MSVEENDKATNSEFSTGDAYNTPGYCTKEVYFQSSTLNVSFKGECSRKIVRTATSLKSYQYSFESPAIAWEGPCVQGKCQICIDGATRCLPENGAAGFNAKSPTDHVDGVPQLCVNGQWTLAKGYGLYNIDRGSDAAQLDINTKALISVTVLTAACLLALIAVVVVGFRQPKSVAAMPPIPSIVTVGNS